MGQQFADGLPREIESIIPLACARSGNIQDLDLMQLTKSSDALGGRLRQTEFGINQKIRPLEKEACLQCLLRTAGQRLEIENDGAIGFGHIH